VQKKTARLWGSGGSSGSFRVRQPVSSASGRGNPKKQKAKAWLRERIMLASSGNSSMNPRVPQAMHMRVNAARCAGVGFDGAARHREARGLKHEPEAWRILNRRDIAPSNMAW
jgi:hypothetical protein